MSEPKRVVVYGTSLSTERTIWPWRRCGGAWVALLRDHYADTLEVFNHSGWGKDSRWAHRYFKNRVLRFQPSILLMEFAVNDADDRRGISVEQSSGFLREMLTELRAECPRCRAVIMTTNSVWGRHLAWRSRLDRYYEAWRSVARENERTVCDMEPAWKALAQENTAEYKRLIPDGIHPGPESAAFFFGQLEPILDKELQAVETL